MISVVGVSTRIIYTCPSQAATCDSFVHHMEEKNWNRLNFTVFSTQEFDSREKFQFYEPCFFQHFQHEVFE